MSFYVHARACRHNIAASQHHRDGDRNSICDRDRDRDSKCDSELYYGLNGVVSQGPDLLTEYEPDVQAELRQFFDRQLGRPWEVNWGRNVLRLDTREALK